MSNEHKIEAEVIREDEGAQTRKALQAMREQLERDKAKHAEAREAKEKAEHYGIGDCLYLLVTKLPSREGTPDRFRGEVISGFPNATMSVVVFGTSPDDCIFEARIAYIDALYAAGVEKDRGKAKDRACAAQYLIQDVLGL